MAALKWQVEKKLWEIYKNIKKFYFKTTRNSGFFMLKRIDKYINKKDR